MRTNVDQTLIRNANGRFTKGNPGGPGNPNACRVSAFRKTLLAAVKEKDIKQIVAKLVAKSKQGDIAATKLLLSYTVGAPTSFEITEEPELKADTSFEEEHKDSPAMIRIRELIANKIREKSVLPDTARHNIAPTRSIL